MRTNVFLIAEDSHTNCKDLRNELKNEVIESSTQIFGYEGYCYRCTPSAAKLQGIYGIDDWIYSIFAKLIMAYDFSVKKDIEGCKKWLQSAFMTCSSYKNQDFDYYNQNKNVIKETINQILVSMNQPNLINIVNSILDGLIVLCKLTYEHPEYKNILINQEKRNYFELKFNLKSMSETFDRLKNSLSLDNKQLEFLKLVRTEIVFSLRNISLSENIIKIIEEAKKLDKDAIFSIGEAHAGIISEYLQSFGIEVIECVGYEDFYQELNKNFSELSF